MSIKFFKKFIRRDFSGFTLIELLVVIAIIGILSAIIVTNLSSTKSKSQDAALKVTLNEIRAQSSLFFNENGGYGTPSNTCSGAGSLFVDPKISTQIAGAVSQGGGGATCRSIETAWAISVPLKDISNSWCVDSNNASRQITGALGVGQYSCP